MYKIVSKKELNPTVTKMEIEAPFVAAKAEPGQFIILRVDEEGERIPLTVAGYDRQKGTVTIIVQTVGATTEKLSHLNEGDCLQDFVGPLGLPTEVEALGRVAVLGGGLGCAIALPVARALHQAGNQVDLIGGFKTKEIVILEEEMGQACTDLHICTDDGSEGFHGLVTDSPAWNGSFDMVHTCGPLPMMKAVAAKAAAAGISCEVSLENRMACGIGACLCCVEDTTDGRRCVCTHGPVFNTKELTW